MPYPSMILASSLFLNDEAFQIIEWEMDVADHTDRHIPRFQMENTQNLSS